MAQQNAQKSARKVSRHPACRFYSDKPWLDFNRSADGTIMKPDELEKEMEDPPDHIDDDIFDRIHGAMIGMAVGDALGAHVEFRPHQYMVENPVATMKGGGTWSLEKGQFTDDTSMALCLANSLVARQEYAPYDQLVRYKWWYRNGYMSSTGECFDIGAATRNSLVEFESRQKRFAKQYKIPLDELDFLSDPELLKKFPVKCSEKGVTDNGALMRLAPVPLFFYQDPIEAVNYSGLSGEITHGDDKAYDACRYYGALIVAALHGESKAKLLDKNFYKNHHKWFGSKVLHPDIMKIAEGSYQKKGGYENGIRGKRYIVNALEAALWAFWSDKDSFEKGVLAAVNLGDDTDTTAAIYGQLAGAYYGYKNLPKLWVEEVYAKDFIECSSKWIAYEGIRWSLKNFHISSELSTTPQTLIDTKDGLSVQNKIFNVHSVLKKSPKTDSWLPKKVLHARSGSSLVFKQTTDSNPNDNRRQNSVSDFISSFKFDSDWDSEGTRPESSKHRSRHRQRTLVEQRPQVQKQTTFPFVKSAVNYQKEFSVADHSTESDKSARNTKALSATVHRVIIVWFEPTFSVRNDFQQMLRKLEAVCYNVFVYTNIDECLGGLIHINSDYKAYLLTSGIWAIDLFNHLQCAPIWESINTIFIYSPWPQQYEFLREQYPCIDKIYSSIEDVASAIWHCVDRRCEVLRFFSQRSIRDLSTDETTAAFIWFIVFKDALLNLPYNEKAKNDMLDVCNCFYMSSDCKNSAQLTMITDFKNTYLSEDAPKWYSYSGFLYKLINRALRTQDVEQLYVFRYFIRDLSSWISQKFDKIAECKEKFFLYRGSALSKEDFDSLDPGKLLAPNGFFSTTRDIQVAKLFIGSSRTDTVRVLYKIECDMASYSPEERDKLVAFADISEKSLMPDEQEVLFDLGATFEIEYIELASSENGYVIIHLIPSGEGTYISCGYLLTYRKEIENSSDALKFGALLLKTGKYGMAQYYFEQLLSDAGSESVSDIYYYLGWAHMEQKDYGRAIINFERAHDLIPNENGILRARFLNSIGKALVEKGLIKEALSYYQKALDLRISSLGNEHDEVIESYTNLARIYNLNGDHQIALEYYKKSTQTHTESAKQVNDVNIREAAEEVDCSRLSDSSSSSSIEDHHLSRSDSASSYYEMGSIQYELGEPVSGLHNMKRSLSMDKRAVTSSSPDLHSSFHSLGNVASLVDHNTKEIEYRLRRLEHAKKHSPKTGTEITKALEDVAFAYAAAEKFNNALWYYSSALSRQEKLELNSEGSLQIAQTVNCIGNMHRSLHQYEHALRYYRRALNIYEKFPSETKLDQLRINSKIQEVTLELLLKNNKSPTPEISKNRSTFTRLFFNRKQKKDVQRSGSFSSEDYFS